MTSLLEENEFLKSELDAYRNELTMAREAFEKELNLLTLAHAALMQNREPSKEYMCRECGYIYESVGYKLLEVQIPEASTSTRIEEGCPTAPQEPVGPSIKQEQESEHQTSRPLQVDAAIQTEKTTSQPTTSNATTQTPPWDPLEQLNKWKKQYAEEQDKILCQHKLQWQSYAYANWDNWDQIVQQHREFKKEAKESKVKIALMFSLIQKLMATRKPFVNYSLYLSERLVYFQLRAIRNGRPYELMTAEKFVETFKEAPESDQHLLCELYLHNQAVPDNRQVNFIPITGDIQIRAFVSFLSNLITWETAFTASRHNEENKLLWIRPEPSSSAMFVAQYYEFLEKPGMKEYMQQL